ncbi:uncharacterized protein LOC144917451 [Branchiostoma floridae x Branchiostoma belcheri]
MEREGDNLGAPAGQGRTQPSTLGRRVHQLQIHEKHAGPDSDLDAIIEEEPEEDSRTAQRLLSAARDLSADKVAATNDDEPAISEERAERGKEATLGAINGHSTDEHAADDLSTKKENQPVSDAPPAGEKETQDSRADDTSPLLKQPPSLTNEPPDEESEDGEESPSVPLLVSIPTEQESCL